MCAKNTIFESNMKSYSADYLSLNNSKCLKGIFAIFVFLHHISQRTDLIANSRMKIIFQSMGYLSVAVFFFLSGFGLMAQYKNKGNNYIDKILPKNMLALYCDYLVLVIIYTLFRFFMHTASIMVNVIKSVLLNGTIVEYGWFLQVLLLYYVGFYIIFKFISNDNVKICAIFIYLVCYCIICVLLQYPATRYESGFAFLLGCIWCKYKVRIDKILTERYLISLILAFTLFCVSYKFTVQKETIYLKMISVLFFVMLVIVLIIRIPIQNALINILGTVSFEIYVMQGISYMLFHSEFVYIENKWAYIIACVTCTGTLAFLIHPLFQLIKRKITKNCEI